jgi:hypothetical protein
MRHAPRKDRIITSFSMECFWLYEAFQLVLLRDTLGEYNSDTWTRAELRSLRYNDFVDTTGWVIETFLIFSVYTEIVVRVVSRFTAFYDRPVLDQSGIYVWILKKHEQMLGLDGTVSRGLGNRRWPSRWRQSRTNWLLLSWTSITQNVVHNVCRFWGPVNQH